MKFNLWKNLKRRIRRGRRPLLTLGCCLLLLGSGPLAGTASAGGSVDHAEGEPAPGLSDRLQSGQPPVNVRLRRTFLCGEELKLLGVMPVKKVVYLLSSHPQWTATLDNTGAVELTESVDDLSETCKKHAVIGLDKNGNLSLFDGPPKKEKVVRTFFQLDMRYLESALPKEEVDRLINGIRVQDKDEYDSVLSTFTEFALNSRAASAKTN
ncbi:BofC C-terminal domain-containing protein [Paenibacillus beijingensis]|uniref:Bypass of forespore C C-terminal domain-containing protein n=1 Tax=Paenibacillus beijingensis TaxID=1126833 RepID=A0A0D5NL49_9BACL|nr:BofC C-terminal domain-containing protein [Paenibacillus beijingensis]AJY76079.1 hypothetical protein VN24_17830 [Paenibacillus beijingensis]